MTLYLIEGKEIAFKHVYYSPTLWDDAPEREDEFETKREVLLELKIPLGSGVVGKVIEDGEAVFFSLSQDGDAMFSMAKDTGFEVSSMLTVPLNDVYWICWTRDSLIFIVY